MFLEWVESAEQLHLHSSLTTDFSLIIKVRTSAEQRGDYGMYVPMTFFTVMANVGFDIRQRETVKGLSDFFKTNFKIHGNGFIYIFAALPDGWYRFGSKLIKLFPEQRTWEQAQQFCRSIGGELVSVNNKDENEFISHLLNKMKTDAAGDCHINFFCSGKNQLVELLQVLISSVADTARPNMVN